MREVAFHQDNLAKHGVDLFEAEEALVNGWKRRRKTGTILTSWASPRKGSRPLLSCANGPSNDLPRRRLIGKKKHGALDAFHLRING